jgi:drug/metabolite transporter (DMT)-like permease
VFQVLLERRLPRFGNILGIVFVLVGLWFLTVPSGSGLNLGDGLTLGCAVVFSLYIVYIDVLSKDIDTMQLLFLQMASNATLALVGTAWSGSWVLHLSVRGFAAIAYLTIAATIVTSFLQTRFQKETTPTRAAIIFSVEPVVAAILAAFMLGEELGVPGMFGASCIVGGVVVSELSGSLREMTWVRMKHRSPNKDSGIHG